MSTPKNRRSELRSAAISVLSLLCCFTFLACTRSPSIANPNPKAACVPSAHRGDRKAGPDNSIATLRSAVDRSFPFIEVDVRLSPSGTLFLFHDRHLKQYNYIGSDALVGRPVSSLSDKERATIALPNFERVPTLTEALSVIKYSQSTVQLDLKPDSEEMVHRVVRTLRTAPETISNVVIQCQELTCVKILRRDYPEQKVLARIFDLQLLAQTLALSPTLVQIDADKISADIVTLVHSAGAKLLVKSLGSPPDTRESWGALCDQGVDIVLTDHPRDF